MTVPACLRCNQAFSQDELRVAAIVCTVSFLDADQIALAPGGWVHASMERDHTLRDFIQERLGPDGLFRPDEAVLEAISRIATKTAAGLMLHEFGRVVPLSEIALLAVEHTKTIHPSAAVELHRRVGAEWAEVTASGRELERQVIAATGAEPPNMPKWRAYLPGLFEYMFIHRSNERLLTAMKLHETLTVLVETPWPSRAGPRRGGKPRKARRI